jgi:hypothetical protein
MPLDLLTRRMVMRELNELELDAVGAGQARGLVAVNLSDIDVTVTDVHVLENFLNDSVNNLLQNGVITVQAPIGIAANVLGAGAAALAHARA